MDMDLSNVPVEDLIEVSKFPLFRKFNRSAVQRWIAQGKLNAAKLGSRWLTTRAAIDDFLKSCQPQKQAPAPSTKSKVEREKAFVEAAIKVDAEMNSARKKKPTLQPVQN